MENASKALIIAGAILVTIIIISLGIMIVNNARSSMGDASLSKEQIEAFNLKWTTYLGTDKRASDVSGLLSAIIANNQVEPKKQVKVTYAAKALNSTSTAVTNALPATIPSIDSSYSFKIEATKYENGLVSLITITKL